MSTFYTWRQAVIKSQLASTTRHVLLTLGCHMNDMGESCYPSIETLCDETGLSNRAVITHLKLAVDAGFIQCDRHGFSGQKWARNEYKATFPPIKAVNVVHDLEEKAVNVVPEGSERSDVKAVNDVHTSSSINYSINNSNPRESVSPEVTNKPMRPEGVLACRLLKLNIAVTSMHPTLLRWVEENIADDLIDECIGLARMQKPWPETIAPGYLDKIIRNQLQPKSDNSWLMSDEGVLAKGVEVGCLPKVGESMQDYRTRLKAVVVGGGKRAA
ncbi:MAG TPA: helix-turn-helix domain-containing protein [Methylophilus sp.]|uniref:helix-turn-helix domain-containing protein n=1 Tax=Methylophilus sp. TaxID=29541 RepID=UPI002D05A09D|nr:helix-turn-helix domain-containing protein [Methylophilus sp.]HSH86876.1 helix-turn-helix domain-containing protein [Methylophilus sp.]